jgi:hypothetical protein
MFFLFYIHNTNYKKSTLNKNYIKQFKIYKITPKTLRIAGKAFCTTGIVSGRLLEPQDSGGTSTPHATATGGAWVHAPPPENPGKQGSVTASSPLPVLAGVTCKTPKNTTGSRF